MICWTWPLDSSWDLRSHTEMNFLVFSSLVSIWTKLRTTVKDDSLAKDCVSALTTKGIWWKRRTQWPRKRLTWKSSSALMLRRAPGDESVKASPRTSRSLSTDSSDSDAWTWVVHWPLSWGYDLTLPSSWFGSSVASTSLLKDGSDMILLLISWNRQSNGSGVIDWWSCWLAQMVTPLSLNKFLMCFGEQMLKQLKSLLVAVEWTSSFEKVVLEF